MTRPDRDRERIDIADYVCDTEIDSDRAFETAHYCLMDALACAFQALDHPPCTKLLGPVAPGATLPGGARVPGTSYELDPVTAAFNIGAMIRWLDLIDAWLAAERGHPSDSLGGILAVADYLSRRNRVTGEEPLTMNDVLAAMIKAYEIQRRLMPGNGDNAVGPDHMLPVCAASAAVATRLLGGDRECVLNALAHAWFDDDAPQACRQVPDTGSRTSRAVADATSRGARLAMNVGPRTAGNCGDGRSTDSVVVSAPAWRRERREESIRLLQKKFADSVSPRLGAGQWEALAALCADRDKLAATAVDDFMALLVA